MVLKFKRKRKNTGKKVRLRLQSISVQKFKENLIYIILLFLSHF